TMARIVPVAYIARRGPGRCCNPIAAEAAAVGAKVALVSGPVNIPDPPGVTMVRVESAREMFEAVEAALPADCAIFAAAVADWRGGTPGRAKIKKRSGTSPPRTRI